MDFKLTKTSERIFKTAFFHLAYEMKSIYFSNIKPKKI